MKGKRLAAVIFIAALLTVCPGAHAKEVFKVQLFFGLSIPGGGAVSLGEWEEFRDGQIAKAFEGLDVMDTMGFYKGAPERSKVLTILLSQDEMHKAVELAKSFATQSISENRCRVLSAVLQFPNWAAVLSSAYNVNVTTLRITSIPNMITGNLLRTTNPQTTHKNAMDRNTANKSCPHVLSTRKEIIPGLMICFKSIRFFNNSILSKKP